MRILEYLYCRFYQLMVSVGNGDIAVFASVLFLTFIFGLNVLTIYDLLYIIGLNIKSVSKPIGVIIFLAPAVIFYVLLVYDGKSSKILDQYAGELKKDKLKGRIILVAYVVLSMAAVIVSFLLMAMKNKGKL